MFQASRGSVRVLTGIVLALLLGALSLAVAAASGVARGGGGPWLVALAAGALGGAMAWKVVLFRRTVVTAFGVEQATPFGHRRVEWTNVERVSLKGLTVLLHSRDGGKLEIPAALYKDPEAAIARLQELAARDASAT